MENGIVHGDCLDVMAGMEEGSVDLVYLDPPYNSGREYIGRAGRFDDRWESWNHYLGFMEERLAGIRRVLSSTGSVWLHCDPTASHRLRILMDEIFGEGNFRNEIVWCYTGPGSPGMRQFNRKHDTIFWYSNGPEWTFNGDAVRQPYRDPNQRPRRAFDTGGHFEESAIGEMRERGKIPESWWVQEPGNGLCIVPRMRSQNTGYPTQKPLALLERIVAASSNPGDLVFDPFCGSGTTAVAAKRFGRRWLACDQESDAVKLARSRIEACAI